MTNIIETIARALCEAQGYRATENEVARAAEEAQAAITALTEAGYAIVPIEPTEAMVEAGMDFDERHLELSLGRLPTVEECQAGEWRAMIDAGRGR